MDLIYDIIYNGCHFFNTFTKWVLNVNIQICYDFNKSLIESDYYVLDTEKVTDNCPGHKFGIFKLSRQVVISDLSFCNYKMSVGFGEFNQGSAGRDGL